MGKKVPPGRSNIAPRWDTHHRKLWLGARLVLDFSRDAPDQIAVLEEFEAKGWPPSISVRHLVPKDANKKAWVKYTARNMNHHNRGMLFHGNGANQTIGWGVV